PPAEYLATTYYEHWLYGLERLLVEKGLVTGKELEAMRPQGPVAGVKALGVDDLPKALRNRRAARMDDHLATPRFKAGDRVRTKNLNPTGHTRLPRYARDKVGVIDRDDGVLIFADGPVFRAPWEAQAFGMAVMLHARGHFTWKEWAERLAGEIAAAQARGESDDGTRYYYFWLAALERLVADKRLVLEDELATRKHEWDRAARATPHGQPIELPGR